MSATRPGAHQREPTLVIIPGDEGCRVEHLESALSFEHSFVTGELPRRAAQPGQALLKACRDRRRQITRILDTTAGWGGDSLTLARHGLAVTMLERHPDVYHVLELALSALAASGQSGLAERLQLRQADACDFLAEATADQVFDCIYLDPMFPPRSSGAKPGKAMQILQAITDNINIEHCFELALTRARRRVVVKRPARAARLDDRVPDIVQREKTVRFDVYLTA